MRTTLGNSIIIAVLAVLAVSAIGEAQPAQDAGSDKVAGKAAGPRTPETPVIEPAAIEAIERMGAFLRDQQSFTVRTTAETDYVLDAGQTVRIPSKGEVRVRRPDHLRATVISDRKERQFFYDGKTFTMYGPRLGFYASVAAPPTIVELADSIEARHGLVLPMVDLFRWGTKESGLDALTSAVHVGTSTLDGVVTDHYAFRQPGLDWQIWIERGERPVPRKLVLTTTDDPARPEYTVEMAWELGTRHADATFAFVPPKDSQRIALAEIAPAPGETARTARRRPQAQVNDK